MARFVHWLRLLLRMFYAAVSATVTFTVIISVGARVTISDTGDAGAIGYHTAIAQRTVATLSDGSIININADSTLFVQESRHERQIFLPKGEMSGTIHHDDNRPLKLFVNHAVIVDLGTQFNVAVHGNVTNVSVTEGQLQIRNRLDNGTSIDPVLTTAAGAHRTPVILMKGDSARLVEQDGMVFATPGPRDLSLAQDRTAWLQGQFSSPGQRLDEVVWQFDRYHHQQILVDPEVAQMDIGGQYSLDDVDLLLSTLKVLGLEVTPVKNETGDAEAYILRRRPPRAVPRAISPSDKANHHTIRH